MADHTDPRAEAAFRSAFAEHARHAPDDRLEMSSGRRRRWLPVAAAAAVLALLGGAGLAAVVGGQESAPPGDGDTPTAASGELPAPEPGQRWVSWRDVAVQVPQEWGYGREPGEDWCADDGNRGEGRPQPYVALDPSYGGVLAIGCFADESGAPAIFGPAPEQLWQTHVALEAADGPDVTETHDGWTTTTRTLGDVRVRLLTDDPAATEGILASATTFTTDQHGCDATSPAQAEEFVRPPAFDVTEVEGVDAISVCQYNRDAGLDRPGLMASHRVTGAEATGLLRGFQQAPEGGGPDRPQDCLPDDYGDTVVVVRLHQDGRTDDLHVYYDHCFGNGSDDGTTRRALTAETCAPLFAPPVTAWSYQSNLARICGTSD